MSLAGYVLTLLVTVVGPSSTGGSITSVLNQLGFVFYSAHNVLVLLATGLGVASRPVRRTDDPVRVGAAIVAVAAGYAVAMVAGTFVFTSQSVFGGLARLPVEDALLFGLAYPLVFATLGAGVAGIVAHLRTDRSTTPA